MESLDEGEQDSFRPGVALVMSEAKITVKYTQDVLNDSKSEADARPRTIEKG